MFPKMAVPRPESVVERGKSDEKEEEVSSPRIRCIASLLPEKLIEEVSAESDFVACGSSAVTILDGVK